MRDLEFWKDFFVSYIEHSQLLMRNLLDHIRKDHDYLQQPYIQQIFKVHYETAREHLTEHSLNLFYKYITDIDVRDLTIRNQS